MPPKKAAKKAAKKAPAKHDPNKAAKDTRRAFEHLGRVQALSDLTSAEKDGLRLLTQTAENVYRAQQYKESADLLRAAEHLSFASLNRNASEAVSKELEETIQEEFEHLMERSRDHSSENAVPKSLIELLAHMSHEAQAALQRGSYRAALEYARGAEALSHVHELGDRFLPSRHNPKRLPN